MITGRCRCCIIFALRITAGAPAKRATEHTVMTSMGSNIQDAALDIRPCGGQGLQLSAQGFGCMSLTKGASLTVSWTVHLGVLIRRLREFTLLQRLV